MSFCELGFVAHLFVHFAIHRNNRVQLVLGLSRHEPQKKDCNINEHDVKYWNEDSAKIYHEDKEGRNEKIEQTSAQKKDGNNSQTNQPNNVLYNVKINQNPS